jgi:hypothetical protein
MSPDSIQREWKEWIRCRIRQEFLFATFVLGEEEGRLLWKEIAKKPRGKPKGSTQPDKDQALLWLYDSLANLAQSQSMSITSLPRRIGQRVHNDVPGRFGNSAIAITTKLGRLLKRRDNEAKEAVARPSSGGLLETLLNK